uniref:Uncharacterized protein n=1 Tax=Setaria viridis TaxID=4556 RepID=A0A4V6D8Y5_SETVI|nr:hypothetical protein SEVIR_3G002200v2 [Setaria viridis]
MRLETDLAPAPKKKRTVTRTRTPSILRIVELAPPSAEDVAPDPTVPPAEGDPAPAAETAPKPAVPGSLPMAIPVETSSPPVAMEAIPINVAAGEAPELEAALALYFFCSGRPPVRAGITPPPLHMEWRPSLEPVATGEGGSRLVATRPPLMGVTSPQWVASAAAVVMAAIPVAATGPGVEEERRDARLHASPGGGAHGSPAWSGLEEAGGPAVGDAVAVVEANPSPEMVEAQARAGDLPSRTGSGAMEVVGAEGEQLPASCNIPVVDILSDVEEDTGVAQPGVPPSQERAVILASLGAAAARSSGRSGADRELVWPQPGEPGKARFVLHDGKEQELWGLLEQSGLSVQSDLALTAARLKEALERVKLAHQAVSVDLPRVAEVGFL